MYVWVYVLSWKCAIFVVFFRSFFLYCWCSFVHLFRSFVWFTLTIILPRHIVSMFTLSHFSAFLFSSMLLCWWSMVLLPWVSISQTHKLSFKAAKRMNKKREHTYNKKSTSTADREKMGSDAFEWHQKWKRERKRKISKLNG